MLRSLLAVIVAALATSARSAELPLKTLPGFTIQKVAGEPLLKYPVSMDLDEKGRLYVTEMAGPISREDVAAQKPLHRIVCLEDLDGDGKYDKASTFADGLPFPEGIMVLNGSVYTACPPKIWKLTDTNGDGKADRREVWFDGKTLTGCANDLHGPYAGPDGWIYWTKGAFAKQELILGNGKPFSTRASHVFRARPDGSGLEVLMTGGMDNPVGLAFTATGDVIVSNTFLQHPSEGKRDGLIHAIPGGIWGKDHDPIYEHPWTTLKTMPIMTHMGPAAPSGIRRYTSTQFGDDFRDNLFCTQFNLRKVSRHVLVHKGSTYETQDSDFVFSDDPDFHPTDVLEDADGSLLIIDTGGWYKLCCPSSQLVKAEAFGGIYRVKKTGSHQRIERRPVVQLEAANPAALLQSDHLHDRRRGATELARTRMDPNRFIPILLGLLADPRNDQHLETAIVHALIQYSDYNAVAKGLTHSEPAVVRASLTALQAIDPNKLSTADVIPLLTSTDKQLRETSWWIAAKHTDWGQSLVSHFRERFRTKLSTVEQEELIDRLAMFSRNTAVQQLLAEMATNPISLKAMARSGVKTVPTSWSNALASAVHTEPAHAIATILALPIKEFPKELRAALTSISENPKSPPAVRLGAMASMPGHAPNESNFSFILSQLKTESPVLRSKATDVLVKSELSRDQLTALLRVFKIIGPVEINRLLPAFGKSPDESVGLALLAELNEPRYRTMIRSEQLKPILEKYPVRVKSEAAKLYTVLDAEILKQREKLEAILKALPAGDVLRGHKVFNSVKAACATCHKIGYVGGVTGPDLTRIGSIRTERDLLEAIVYPSLSFVRSYEPISLETVDGRQLNGILKKDAPDEVILVTGAEKYERIPREQIESLKPGTVSIMPAGLDQQLSQQDLADLVAFLRAAK